MDLATKLIELEKRTSQHRELLLTEEAAKTALVMPFLQALGYDVFNPAEVIPEFTADVGVKKGERVDYALCIDGKLSILVECKPSSVELDLKHASQLFRYFATTDARVAILTNGVVYQFYSDIDQPNKMDEKPFFIFSMDAIRRSDPLTLERFARHQFDIDAILTEAGRLKLESQMRIELEREFSEPSDELVRLIASRVQPGGRMTAAVREQLQPLLAASIAGIIRDRVNERITSALNVANPAPDSIAPGDSDDMSVADDGVVTTEDEIAGFRIVQAICATGRSKAHRNSRLEELLRHPARRQQPQDIGVPAFQQFDDALRRHVRGQKRDEARGLSCHRHLQVGRRYFSAAGGTRDFTGAIGA